MANLRHTLSSAIIYKLSLPALFPLPSSEYYLFSEPKARKIKTVSSIEGTWRGVCRICKIACTKDNETAIGGRKIRICPITAALHKCPVYGSPNKIYASNQIFAVLPLALDQVLSLESNNLHISHKLNSLSVPLFPLAREYNLAVFTVFIKGKIFKYEYIF